MNKSSKHFEEILLEHDIQVGGSRPWDVKINNPGVYNRILAGGSLALGETFMDGDWDCEDLAQFFDKIFSDFKFENIQMIGMTYAYIKAKVFNLQAGKRSVIVGQKHYDIGNDLYKAMLDPVTLSYTCAYYTKKDESLSEAQVAKLDLICKKLGLKAGDRVLDIGCGWGNFMKYAAENYGVKCTGLSVSKEQIKLGKERCEGLPVEFVFTNYEDYTCDQKFDHIVSIEMFEAVGRKNFKKFFKKASDLLSDDGLFLLQTISNRDKSESGGDPWIDKYIFPNGELPTLGQICNSIEHPEMGTGLLMIEDVHNIGTSYDRTLMEWWVNFDKAYLSLKENNSKYDERFYRMWKYYLQFCAGMFRSRKLQNYQIVFSKKGVRGGYTSIR